MSSNRECPVCGTPIPGRPAGKAGRPQVYCSERCRWRAGHIAAAEQRRRMLAAQPEWTTEELLAWAETAKFRDPC